jgi:lipopolysaccharide/colanic/teichoic acid biosynthesis glycosyltransferase
MSFVGPRALLPVEIEVRQSNAMQEQKYANGGELLVDAIPGYDQRITVRPGLTGIAQVWAPRDILRRHKFKYDLLYIRKRSFWLDLRLLSISFLITFNAAWERRGSKLKLQNLR